jgi:hypothetical protein
MRGTIPTNCDFKPCTERAHVHEVQIMELALRARDNNREWFASLDKCIARDSTLDIDALMSGGLGGGNGFDERILHLPVLWKSYHDRLLKGEFGLAGSFWIAMIREETEKRLAVSCGEIREGHSIDSTRSSWSKATVDEQTESWNEDVSMDASSHGDFLGGAEHWAKFKVL